MPLSALIAKAEVFQPFDRMSMLHSSPLAANPMACAAVRTSATILIKQGICEKATLTGEILTLRLGIICSNFDDLFSKVRGRGLMLGLHCKMPEVASYFIRHCLQKHLIVTPCL